jgi:GNAT superfamily N-acetyltransferase
VERIRRLTDLTVFFNEDEVAVATELVEERLVKGKTSGYFFVLADYYDRLVGYTCHGPIPDTRNSFDLYWIAVHLDFQRRGLGVRLLQQNEKQCRHAGVNRIYIDTSQRDQYAGTRAFYEINGYRLESVLKDFYTLNDGKVIYCKVFVPT